MSASLTHDPYVHLSFGSRYIKFVQRYDSDSDRALCLHHSVIMFTIQDDVKFTAPHYGSQSGSDDIVLDDSDRGRRFSQASTVTGSTTAKKWPSLAADEERRRSSGADKNSSSIPSRPTDLKNKEPRFSVGTQDALTNFAPIAADYLKKEEERQVRLRRHPRPGPHLEENLDRLRLGHRNSYTTLRRLWSWLRRTPPAHEEDDLEGLAKLYFPPRSQVKVYITDFKEHSAYTYECKLSEITVYMRSKPDDVQVRWIHAPLGLGPVHSTIEDLFRHGGRMGRPFTNTGRMGFPYAVVEVLNLCDRTRFQKTRDVYHFLHDEHQLTRKLNAACWTGFEDGPTYGGLGVLDDLRWRTTHLGLAHDWKTLPDFWTACNSDVSWQMSEGLIRSNYGPLDGLNPTLWQSDKQALHKHRFFGSSQLVRDPFRCFHRDDGRSQLRVCGRC